MLKGPTDRTPFEHRGVVEGFYGPAFDPIDRLWLVEAMGRWGMNRYLYAPKDDPRHRERWREPYPSDDLEQFRQLVECGGRSGVSVGFAISPGLSICYSSSEDVAQLVAKLISFQDLGVRFFGLALDDVPSTLQNAEDRRAFSSLGEAHAALTNAVQGELASDVKLWLIPTDYSGTGGSQYLSELGSRLDPSVEVGWTGRSVLSPTITRAEAESRARALGRPLLVWDNVPVADGPMRPMLHLGPYVGRDPDLAGPVSGILLNPMEHVRASAIALRTAADYLLDPAHYEPETAWSDAIEELAGEASKDFEIFAQAHRFSAMLPGDRDRELDEAFEALKRACGTQANSVSARFLFRECLEARTGASDRLQTELEDARLLAELEPWIEAHQHECRRMRAAIDLLDALEAELPRMDRMLAFFRFEGRLTRIPTPLVASFGPRRVIYPQLVSLEDEDACFGDDDVLFRDLCLADAVVELAENRAAEALGLRVRRDTTPSFADELETES